MTRPAVRAAATAIVDAIPSTSGVTFPTIGIIRRILITRDDDTDLITNLYLLVGIPGMDSPVVTGYSGALTAEIDANRVPDSADARSFVGRNVKVELINGQMIAAYIVYIQ